MIVEHYNQQSVKGKHQASPAAAAQCDLSSTGWIKRAFYKSHQRYHTMSICHKSAVHWSGSKMFGHNEHKFLSSAWSDNRCSVSCQHTNIQIILYKAGLYGACQTSQEKFWAKWSQESTNCSDHFNPITSNSGYKVLKSTSAFPQTWYDIK